MTDLDDLIAAVTHLSANVLNGTPMPYRAPHLTPEQREEADRKARQERLERVNIAPGDSPDPYRMDIVELLSDILCFADTMWDEVCFLLDKEQGPPAHSFMADPTPWLVKIKRWVYMLEDEHAGTLQEIEMQSRILVNRASAMLGLVNDGQHLPHDCPFCGHDKLRIRSLPVADAYRPHIVCEGPLCTVRPEKVTLWHRGRPAWDLLNEGEWFAANIEAVDRKQRCRCGDPLPVLKVKGRPSATCSEQCRREADAERKREERAA